MSGRSKKAYPEGRHVPYSLCMEPSRGVYKCGVLHIFKLGFAFRNLKFFKNLLIKNF